MHIVDIQDHDTEVSGDAISSWSPLPEGFEVEDTAITVEFAPILVHSPAPVMHFQQRIVYRDRHALAPDNAKAVVRRTLWSRTFDSQPAAKSYSRWMHSEADSWPYWGQFCLAFGPAVLVPLIDAEVAKFQSMEFEKREKRLLKADRKQNLAEVIESYVIERKGHFGITLQRGDANSPFFVMMFREKWERERFRDWFRHQSGHFARFAQLLDAGSSVELERHLLAEMLRTESDVKRAGLGAGGRRPLRFYRGDA